MRVLTWNVNGIKAAIRRFGTLQLVLECLQADIICLQETKVKQGDVERDLAVVPGWHSFFSCYRGKTGYSGVATFCKADATVPLDAVEGLTGAIQADGNTSLISSPLPSANITPERMQEVDSEGRAVVTDHGAFVLFNLYGPALTSEETAADRMAFKLDFYRALEARVRALLAAGRHVLVVGDLNISPQPMDSCCPDDTFGRRPDRVWLNSLLQEGCGLLWDVFRHFHPDRKEAYTCWSTATGARINNYGTRIDHILAASPSGCPAPVHSWVLNSDIWPEFQGSDHAPVWADLAALPSLSRGIHPPPLCSAYMFKGKQSSLKVWLEAARSKLDAGSEGASQTGERSGSESAPVSLASQASSKGKSATASVLAAAKAPSTGACSGSARPPAKRPRSAGQTSLLSFVIKAAPPPAAIAAAAASLNPAGPSSDCNNQSGLHWQQSSLPHAASQGSSHLPEFSLARGIVPSGASTSQPHQPVVCLDFNQQQQQQQQQQELDRAASGAGCSTSGRGQQAPHTGCDLGRQQAGPTAVWLPSAQRHPAPPTQQSYGIDCSTSGPLASGGQAAGERGVHIGGIEGVSSAEQSHPPGGQTSAFQAEPLYAADDLRGGSAGRVPVTAGGSDANANDVGAFVSTHTTQVDMCVLQALPCHSNAGTAAVPAQEQLQILAASSVAVAGMGAGSAGSASAGAAAVAVVREDSASAWRRIQESMRPPRCGGHREECVIRTVKKKGPNNGRQFYVCARPDGPPPVGRCDHFEWASKRAVKKAGG